MQPYSFGDVKLHWRDWDFGPSTKYTGGNYRKRKQDRRAGKKITRQKAKITLRKDLDNVRDY